MSLLEVGDLLGAWFIEAPAGAGAMGSVWRARHQQTGALAAIKVLTVPLEEVAARRRWQRFVVEGQTLARLAGHPHVVGVHAAGALDNGVPWLALEWMPGGSLRDRLRQGPFEPLEAVRVAVALASALGHLHTHGVLHRDVKPENVLFDDAGRAKLADFGLVRDEVQWGEQGLTATGAILGTPAYLAPEGLRGQGDRVGPWTDLWAVGVMLYEMWTGELPFKATSLLGMFKAVRSTSVVSPRKLEPRVSRDAERVCLKAMAKDPDRRYRSADHLARDLECILAGRAPSTHSSVSLGSAVAFIKVMTRGPGMVAIALALVAGTAAWMALGGQERPPKAAPSRTETAAVAQRRQRLAEVRAAATRESDWRRAERAVDQAVAYVDADSLATAQDALAKLEGSPGNDAVRLTKALEQAAYGRVDEVILELLDKSSLGFSSTQDPVKLLKRLEPELLILKQLGTTGIPPPAGMINRLWQLSKGVEDLDAPPGLTGEQSQAFARGREQLHIQLLDSAWVAWGSAHPEGRAETPDGRRIGAIILCHRAAAWVEEHRRQHSGQVGDRCGMVQEALDLVVQSLEFYEGLPQLHLQLARVRYELGEFEAARDVLNDLTAVLRDGVSLFPGPHVTPEDAKVAGGIRSFYLEKAAKFWLEMYAGQESKDQRFVEWARRDFWAAARESTEPGRVIGVMVTRLAERNLMAESRAALAEALEEWPRDGRLQLRWGRVLLDSGRPREALEALEKADASGHLRGTKRSDCDELLPRARAQVGD